MPRDTGSFVTMSNQQVPETCQAQVPSAALACVTTAFGRTEARIDVVHAAFAGGGQGAHGGPWDVASVFPPRRFAVWRRWGVDVGHCGSPPPVARRVPMMPRCRACWISMRHLRDLPSPRVPRADVSGTGLERSAPHGMHQGRFAPGTIHLQELKATNRRAAGDGSMESSALHETTAGPRLRSADVA